MALHWLYEGLRAEPYGMLPLSNLSGKGPTGIKSYEQLASYNWILNDKTEEEPTIVVPGAPNALILDFTGGKIDVDSGILFFDVNHAALQKCPMDPIFHATRLQNGEDYDFQQFDFVTDAINMQKMYTFCKGNEEGLFRVDLERIGRMVIATRVEGQDWMQVDFESYDKSMRSRCTKPVSSLTDGPFQQIGKYKFGDLNLLVRYEAHCCDYSKLPDTALEEAAEALNVSPEKQEKIPFKNADSNLHYIPIGKKQKHHLVLTTSYPSGKDFPFFTYAQLIFSGADQLFLGWFKGGGDFLKPAYYTVSDINKLIKPLPLPTIAKTYACIQKMVNFLRLCEDDARVTFLWQAGDKLEIYERSSELPTGISDTMRKSLLAGVRADDKAAKQAN